MATLNYNPIEILEDGEMFFMDDLFTGHQLIFEANSPDGSASITIRKNNLDLSVCLWPSDLIKLKEFLK